MISGFFTKYFPLPHFLNPNRIGVSFSDSEIKAFYFNGSYRHPAVRSIVIPLEPGIISGGKVLKDSELVKKISLINEIADSRFVSFVVPDELTYVFNVSIPIEKSVDLTESVAFTIEENVPVSLSETVFDFSPISVSNSDSGFLVDVVVVASVKKDVIKFIEAIKNAGFDPLTCLHESQAVANSVIPKGVDDLVSIVNAMNDKISIYLVKKRTVFFATTSSVTDGGYEEEFLDEFNKFLEYSVRYGSGDKTPSMNVFVCGEFECARKVVDVLVNDKNTPKSIKLSNVWSNILEIEKNTPSISYEKSLSLASPIGAVLSELI